MTQKTIELASIDQAQELLIDERTIATYDAMQGPLVVARLVNYGTLRIIAENLNEAQIVAQSVYNLGTIETDLSSLVLHTAEIKSGKGTGRFASVDTLHLKSDGDLRVSGGIFAADVLQVTAAGKAGVHAFRLDANVKVKAKEVALGADDGNLNIVEQQIDGDPIYYQGVVTNGGNMNISVTNMPGEDVSLWAVGNITVNGPINTLGGDDQHIGRITIVGGQQKVAYNGVENDGLVPCVDCSLPFPGLEIVTTPLSANTSVITTGALTGKAVVVEGGTIVTGDILVDNDNISPSRNLAGSCGLVAATSIKTGNVKVIKRDGATVSKGGMTAAAGQNIEIGNVDGSIVALTDQSGLIKVGNVDAGFGGIQMKAGQDFGGGGGGIIGGAAVQSFTTLDAKIQTGSLKTQSGVLLMANGTVGTGTVTLDAEPFSGPNSFVIPHDVRIHANIGKDAAPAFLAGGGGTNGSGMITVTNRSFHLPDEKAGTIVISNGPSGDIHLNGSRLKCVTGDKGTPGIVVDAGSGQIRLVGGSPLSVDGDGTQDPGFIILMGGELRAPNAAIISASDTKGSAETEAPTVILAVDKIALPGSLTVNCNGNTGASVKLAPKGSIGLDIVHTDYTQSIKPQAVSPVVHELEITGTGSLTITANSKNGSILCSGDPLRFANSGATHIESEGDGSLIELKFAGSPSGQDSLIFTGGAVEILTDNPQHNAGTIMVTADKVKNTASSLVRLHSNALSDGDGGVISLDIDRGNLSLGSAPATMSLVATSMGSGAGGHISVENAKHNGTITLDASFSTAALSVAALGSNGDGGSIDLHADHLVNNATSGNSGLVANGVGTGNGGIISLRLTDNIAISGAMPGLSLVAASNGTGDGGQVHLTSTKSSITVEGAAIAVNAGTNGRGGRIVLTATEPQSTITISGLLNAIGRGDKRGGHIEITGAKLQLSQATLRVDGGDASGRGGTIDLTSLTTMTLGTAGMPSLISAEGHGSGDGGSVRLSMPISFATGVDLRFTPIIARGGDTGAGGVVIVANTNDQPFDVNDIINVDPGMNTGQNVFAGSITLNGVECRQYKTSYEWPKTYWNGVNPTNPDPLDAIPAQVASTLANLTSQLEAANVHIYVFQHNVPHSQFFFAPGEPRTPDGGETFNISVGGHIYCSPYREGTRGLATTHVYTAGQLQEVSAHELGHAVDIMNGFLFQQTRYGTRTLRDLANLDWALLGDTQESSVRRNPCTPTLLPDGTVAPGLPPFLGVTDLSTGTLVCNVGTVDPRYNNFSNSQIMQDLELPIFLADQRPYSELGAQTFAFQQGGDQGARPMMDRVFANGHFNCAKGWANAQLAGNAAPAGGDCDTTPPAWYAPFQPKG